MAQYPHTPKGKNKHASGTQYRYTTMVDMAEERRERASIRKEIADRRSPKDRIARLDQLFGKGLGAVRERARIALMK